MRVMWLLVDVMNLVSVDQTLDPRYKSFPRVLPKHSHTDSPRIELSAGEQAGITQAPFSVQLREIVLKLKVIVDPSFCQTGLEVGLGLAGVGVNRGIFEVSWSLA